MQFIKRVYIISLFIAALLLAGCADNDKTDNEQSSKNTDITKQMVDDSTYERPHSPSIGPDSAKVTIVEFFDPACEACRVFYPVVKEIMSRHPENVRLVLRYATFHKDSETVVRLLEAARLQNVFESVLDALLEKQEEWASHHKPNVDRAWEIAESKGLNVEAAKAIMNSEAINKLIVQEMADLKTLNVRQTPTFFVNQKTLSSFGAQQLYELVVSELER